MTLVTNCVEVIECYNFIVIYVHGHGMEKHACMIPKPPCYDDLHPNANCWQQIRGWCRNLLLPCEWHHGSLVFLRSRKSLELERQRQLELGYRFVCHPYSPAKLYWDAIVWLVNVSVGFYMPYQVFRNCPNPADPFILASDCLAFCDVIFIFCTGYIDEGIKEIILKPKKIALNYLKGYFVLDFIAIWPWQLYQPFNDCRYPSHTVFFPIKLLRCGSCKKKMELLLEQLDLSYSRTTLFTLSLALLVFLHWLTYWQYQVPALCLNYFGKLRAEEARWMELLNVDTTTNSFVKYISNLYHVFGLCIGAGYTLPPKHHVLPELIQKCITNIVGIIFLVYCFMIVLRLVLSSQQQHFMFDGAMKELENYMTMKCLPMSLKQKIRLFINYKFGGSYMDETAILNTINEQIKQDINMHTCLRIVLNVPLFEGLPIALINFFIFSLKREAYIPGQDVIKSGEPNDSMYFIYFGTVAVMDEHGNELMHLNDGGYFGEAAILYPDTPATITVTALEITEIYELSNEDFELCIRPYSHLKQRLIENYQNSVSGEPQ